MDRRTFLKSTGVAGAASLAGCLKLIGRRGPIAFTSKPAYIEPSAVSDVGYRYDGIRNFGVEDTLTIDGRERKLDVDSWVTRYRRVEDYEGLFSYVDIFSTPNPKVNGNSVNPLIGTPTAELISTIGKQADGQVSVDKVLETREIELFGETHVVEKLKGSATYQGETVGALIVTVRTQHEGDAVIGLSVYANLGAKDQFDNIVSLYKNIKHPVSRDVIEAEAPDNSTADGN